MPGSIVDTMRPFRDEATLRAEIFLPITFTTVEIGTTPRRIFSGRFPVSSMTVQAQGDNTGKIYYSNDQSLIVGYGFSLSAGGSASWSVTLSDVLQVLGADGFGNTITRERTPDVMSRFRQTRVAIDAAQFWFVADAADQHLSVQISVLPRY